MSVKPRPCTACRSLVYDLEHVTTRRMTVIDVKPDPKGNVLIHLEDGFYTVAPKTMIERMTDEAKAVLHTSHFMTCPYRSQFRKRKEERDAAGG